MGMLAGVMDLFPHTVTIAPWIGQTQYSEALYGDPLTYAAKIERGTDLARGTGGDRAIVPRYKVFIAEAVAVDLRDQLVLDAAFGSRNMAGDFEAPSATIREVVPIYDEREWVCTVIYCG